MEFALQEGWTTAMARHRAIGGHSDDPFIFADSRENSSDGFSDTTGFCVTS